MMFHLNCLERKAALSMDATCRLNALDRGGGGDYESRMDRVEILLPGGHETLFDMDGAGCVETVCCSFLNEQPRGALEQLRLRITFDHAAAPQIDTGAHDFFMSGWEGKQVVGDYAGKTVHPDGTARVYRHIVMPYRTGCRMEIVNQGDSAVRDLSMQVDFLRFGRPVDFGRMGCLRSAEASGRAVAWGQKFTFLDFEGAGSLHSIQMSLKNAMTRGQFMEGNFEIYIDDNAFPEYQSSGTEEFFMGGIYFTNLHTSAYSGCTRTFQDGGENPQNIISAHRYFLEDPITFQSRLRIVWSHGQAGQGTVVGPTSFDFSALYYTHAGMPDAAMPVGAPEATARLNALDGDCAGRPLKAVYLCDHAVTEEPVLTLEGAGTLETLSLELKPTQVPRDLALRFEIDGCMQDTVPFSLFMLSMPDGKPAIADHGGATAPGCHHRFVRIGYRKSLRLFMDTPEPLRCDVMAEYRPGLLAGTGKTHIRCLTFQGGRVYAKPLCPEKGCVQSVAVMMSGSGLGTTLMQFWDGTHKPLIISPALPFYLLADLPAEQRIASQSVYAEETGEGVIAVRFFPAGTFRFQNGLEALLTNAQQGEMRMLVMLSEAEEPVSAQSVQALNQRLNRLDGAPTAHEFRCYNPLETGEYYKTCIKPGETLTMFEDFGAGMITCIRFGTPPKGPALHESRMRIYFNGEESPAIDTTCARFFSGEYGDPLFWARTRALARPSKRGWEKEKNEGQHSSFFRYLRMPYQNGCRFELTAPPDSEVSGFDNVYYAAAHGTAADFGGLNHTEDVTYAGDCAPGGRTLVAFGEGPCLLTSVQLMLECPDADMRKSLLEIFDGDTPLFSVPLHRFFLGPDGEAAPLLEEYLPVWREAIREQEGYYSAPQVGWIRRGSKAPYRDVMYRLFENNPMPFAKGMRIYLTNGGGQALRLQADMLVRRA